MPAQAGNASVTLEVDGDRVGVSAVEETNTLLVRSSPSAWKSIRDVIERLDVMPMQVHIEAQVVEVQLQRRAASTASTGTSRTRSHRRRPARPPLGRDQRWSTLAGSIAGARLGNPGGLAWTFLGRTPPR